MDFFVCFVFFSFVLFCVCVFCLVRLVGWEFFFLVLFVCLFVCLVLFLFWVFLFFGFLFVCCLGFVFCCWFVWFFFFGGGGGGDEVCMCLHVRVSEHVRVLLFQWRRGCISQFSVSSDDDVVAFQLNIYNTKYCDKKLLITLYGK